MKSKCLLPLFAFMVMHGTFAQINGVFIVNGDTINQLQPFSMCSDSCYDFSVFVTGSTPPYTYLWNNGATTENTTYCTANMTNYGDTVMVAVTSSTAQTNTFFVWAINYINSNHEICLVTVDSATQKNKIIWEQSTYPSIKFYNIYKETTTLNQYEVIGSVSRDSLSVFIDTLSHPEQVSAKYKMTASDGCVETIPSISHKTMHLVISPGTNNNWNLIWTPYQGNNISIKNRIWRGSSSLNMVLFDSVSSSVTSYTDVNPPTGILHYAIEMIPQYVCNPSAKNTPYSSSFSNTVDNSDYVGISETLADNEFQILPNPVVNTVQIKSRRNIERIEIIDITGRILYTTRITEINCSNFSKGLYFVRVTFENGIFQKKFIKR